MNVHKWVSLSGVLVTFELNSFSNWTVARLRVFAGDEHKLLMQLNPSTCLDVGSHDRALLSELLRDLSH